ncbi:hypothetical protein PIIN_05002 [Serendipita indica DSM 11827]|uniref:G-patch domain-containing protein n=1 Tax=Serendipita indica (strain DSM 11827) TaxID=1109443 RepID=G4TIE0_SERID|nr:hypothetical protein PIIN_05002 [Serendipita indica DSM 11827]
MVPSGSPSSILATIMTSRGGGLYGGIKFTTPQDQLQQISSSPAAPAIAPVPAQAVVEAAPVPATTKATPVQENTEQPTPETPVKTSAGWSAALAFAPVRRTAKPKAPANRGLPQAAMVASLAAAAASVNPTPIPTVNVAPTEPAPEQESTGWGKRVKAPSMVIDDDVNGFRATKPGEGKRKKKKNINANQIIWDPMEPYDPFHPNDYHEYKKWKQREQQERRMQERRRVEELKRRRTYSHSEYSSEEHSDDGRPSRKTARYHSPEREDDYDAPRGLGSANAFQHSDNVVNEEEPMNISPARPVPLADTGEEAYLRRLQMSRPRPPSPPAAQPPAKPTFAPATQSIPIPAMASPLQPPPVSAVSTAFASNDEMDEEITPVAPAPVQPAPTQLSQATIEERKKTAAAVAARLKALSKLNAAPEPPNPVPPPSEPSGPQPKRDQAGFAARMMEKYGYVQGQGLGANADGIVEPIMLERANAPKATKKGEEGPKKSGAGGMGIGGSKMGRIVNAQAEEKIKADLLRYGESSRIVVLTNMVGPEDVDDDLQGEIGDECSKHGTVERVVVHLPYPTPDNPEDAVRIFVQFAGPAAAWKAVRELDGRFFGGRTVRAKYFDEGNFIKRLFDIPL